MNKEKSSKQNKPDCEPDFELDLTGLRCPLPVLKTQKFMRTMSVGQVVCIKATDPASFIDFPHFCSEQGYDLLSSEDSDQTFFYRIRKT